MMGCPIGPAVRTTPMSSEASSSSLKLATGWVEVTARVREPATTLIWAPSGRQCAAVSTASVAMAMPEHSDSISPSASTMRRLTTDDAPGEHDWPLMMVRIVGGAVPMAPHTSMVLGLGAGVAGEGATGFNPLLASLPPLQPATTTTQTRAIPPRVIAAILPAMFREPAYLESTLWQDAMRQKGS